MILPIVSLKMTAQLAATSHMEDAARKLPSLMIKAAQLPPGLASACPVITALIAVKPAMAAVVLMAFAERIPITIHSFANALPGIWASSVSVAFQVAM